MYTLKDKGILLEIESGNNLGYVLENNAHFINTDYKVLQSQTSGIFVQCMKMLYNGKMELYYVTDDYRPMSSIFTGITPDTFITIVVNLLENVIEVRNNGFLTCQNIDLSWDSIFLDVSTLKVKLVYFPINEKIFDGYAEFESELRSSLVKLINKVVTTANDRIEQLVMDLCNGSLELEDVYNKLRGAGTKQIIKQKQGNGDNPTIVGNSIRIVAMDVPKYFEIIMDREELIIGKKAEIVDAVIPFNKMISRKHCKITRRNGVFYISDEGSVNGTYINRTRIVPYQQCQIKRGDTIRLADSDFLIV
ncbi:FHA domain-containing protein [Anaerosporobacter sp.]